MFLSLSIENYALIQHLELTFSPHLNVITGETGTGKSIILGAIGLLLGNRADSKVVAYKGKKCIVEGRFNIKDYKLHRFFKQANLDYDDHTILRREIVHGGKSRAFINDTPVTVETIGKMGLRLISIHSQHEVTALKNQSSQMRIIDLYAVNTALKKEYQQAWEKVAIAKKHYDSIREEADVLQKESDFIAYQLEELAAARLEKDEQNKLEQDLKIIEHAEEIKQRLNNILNNIYGNNNVVDTILSEVRTEFNALSRYSEKYLQLQERFDSLRIELQDMIAEIEQEESSVEYDAGRAEEVKDRIDLIYKLLHKHKRNTLDELLLLQEEMQYKNDRNRGMDHELTDAKRRLEKANLTLQENAKKLSQSRISVFETFCQETITLLQKLGMRYAKLKVVHKSIAPSPAGMDRITLLFNANKGLEQQPLFKVISGGELSRLVFCVQYVLAKKASLSTLILDEVDTGVSGEIAIRMGNMMKSMANQCQLIIISHLPQIAAKADRHFYVYKKAEGDQARSNIKLLNDDERVVAIAKMIGGNNPPTSARESAKALMKKQHV